MATNGDSTTVPKAFTDLTGTMTTSQFPGAAVPTGTGAVVMATSPTIASPTFTGTLTAAGIVNSADDSARRFLGHAGTALVATDYVASAGWGTSPVITAVRGTDTAATFTVQAKATVGANPTITMTFKNGAWTTAPIVVCGRTELIAATGAPATNVSNEWVPTTISTTQIVFTFNGTPVANSTYGCSFICIGV
jgi:hypothetical protein